METILHISLRYVVYSFSSEQKKTNFLVFKYYYHYCRSSASCSSLPPCVNTIYCFRFRMIFYMLLMFGWWIRRVSHQLFVLKDTWEWYVVNFDCNLKFLRRVWQLKSHAFHHITKSLYVFNSYITLLGILKGLNCYVVMVQGSYLYTLGNPRKRGGRLNLKSPAQ